MLGLFYRAVQVIEDAFSATREYTTKRAKSSPAGRATTLHWRRLSIYLTS